MSHHIYHTQGIILSSIPTGEANCFYKILTEDLGLIGAVAQGVREGKGKLKMVLQDFAWVKVDFVRGKEVWRIISTMEERPAGKLKSKPENVVLFARITSLVRRLVQGEGRNDELFQDVCSAYEFLETTAVPTHLVSSFETLAVLRILARLGYLDATPYEVFCEKRSWDEDLLATFAKVRPRAIIDINDALKASQL